MVPAERLERVAEARRAEPVDVMERATKERWKAESQHGAQVAVGRRAQDALLETPNRLDDEPGGEPLGHVGGPASNTGGSDQLVDLWIGSLLFAIIAIESAPAFAAAATQLHQERYGTSSWQSLSERRGHRSTGVSGDVEPDLVEQLEWSNRPAEGAHRLVDLADVGTPLQHLSGLVHHAADHPRRVEAGPVVDHDGSLAHPLADVDHRRDGPVSRALASDHFDQRHAVDRREEV